MEWIDELDRELSLLREAEARVRYRADLGGDLDNEELASIADRRREVLRRPETVSKATRLAAGATDPVVRRKAELLRLEIIRTRIEDDPELLALQHELERARRAFGEETKTPEGMRSYLKATEPCARERICAANRLARRQGFDNYATAKLACQEVPISWMLKTLSEVHKTFEHDGRRVLAEVDAERLSPQELDRAVLNRLELPTGSFPAEDLAASARDTLCAFGISEDGLPIKIEFADLPYPGAVHALEIRRDIRVVMNEPKGGFHERALLFHELGHALYYAYVPDSVLLLDSRVGREGLAELWAGLIERREWLRWFSDMTDAEIGELLEKRRRWHAYLMMTLVQWTRFDLELYRNPEADFRDVWNVVTRDCLGIDNRTGIYPDFVFLYPLDIKDYVIAHLIREAVMGELERRFGTDLMNADVFGFIVKSCYETGNLVPWHKRLLGLDELAVSQHRS